jgi:hypothetical protein
MRAATAAPRTVTATRGVCNLELPLVFPVALALALALALPLARDFMAEPLAVGIMVAPDAIDTEAVAGATAALAFPAKTHEIN